MALKNRLAQAAVFIVLYAMFEQYSWLNDIFPSGLLGTILKIGTLFLGSVLAGNAMLLLLQPKGD